jgi:hypothetical protein
VLWWQTKLPGMTRQRKQPCEMSTCRNLTLSNGLSMTMSWPLSTAVHFLSMALVALAKPFSTVACWASCAHRVGSLLLWHRLALLHYCWMEAALHIHVSRSLCKASTTRPHATSIGTLS